MTPQWSRRTEVAYRRLLRELDVLTAFFERETAWEGELKWQG